MQRGKRLDSVGTQQRKDNEIMGSELSKGGQLGIRSHSNSGYFNPSTLSSFTYTPLRTWSLSYTWLVIISYVSCAKQMVQSGPSLVWPQVNYTDRTTSWQDLWTTVINILNNGNVHIYVWLAFPLWIMRTLLFWEKKNEFLMLESWIQSKLIRI